MLVECLSHIYCILTGHSVDNQEDFVRSHRLLDVLQLLHHLIIDMKSTGGVQYHDIMIGLFGLSHGYRADRYGILTSIDGEDRNIKPFSQHL